MFGMGGFIFWALTPSFMRLLPFIFESYFHSLAKNFRRAPALPTANHFMTNPEQNIAITALAVSH